MGGGDGMEEVEEVAEYFQKLTNYIAVSYAINSIKTICLRYDVEIVKKAIEIVYLKYNVKTYDDFFALVHGVCKGICHEAVLFEKIQNV